MAAGLQGFKRFETGTSNTSSPRRGFAGRGAAGRLALRGDRRRARRHRQYVRLDPGRPDPSGPRGPFDREVGSRTASVAAVAAIAPARRIRLCSGIVRLKAGVGRRHGGLIVPGRGPGVQRRRPGACPGTPGRHRVVTHLRRRTCPGAGPRAGRAACPDSCCGTKTFDDPPLPKRRSGLLRRHGVFHGRGALKPAEVHGRRSRSPCRPPDVQRHPGGDEDGGTAEQHQRPGIAGRHRQRPCPGAAPGEGEEFIRARRAPGDSCAAAAAAAEQSPAAAGPRNSPAAAAAAGTAPEA